MGVKISVFSVVLASTLCVPGSDGHAAAQSGSTPTAQIKAAAITPASAAYPGPAEVPAGTAVTFWASQPVDRNETVVVSGGNIRPTATVRLTRLEDGAAGSPLEKADSANNGWSSVTPTQATEQSLKFQLPDRARGVYAYQIVTGNGAGATTLVNAPDIWFVQGNVGGGASPRGRLTVFGTALGRMSESSQPVRLALVSNGAVQRILTADASNPKEEGMYAQSFAIPADLPEGDYELYLHNGSGGPSAWSRYENFGVGADRTAPRRTITTVSIAYPTNWPNTQCRVAPPAGNGASDDASFAAAFACAANGGVVSIPAGRYTLSQQYAQGFNQKIPNHVVIAGAGKDATVLSFPTANNTSLFRGNGIFYTPPRQPKCGQQINWATNLFGVRDLAIEAPAMTEGYGIVFEHMPLADLRSVPFVRDIRLTLGRQADRTANGPLTTGIQASNVSNLQISGNDITASKPITMDKHVYGATVQNNTLRWHELALTFNHDVQNALITHNQHISAGAPYHKTPSELGFAAPSRDVYYADNASQYPQDAQQSWQLTMDEGIGNYLGKVAASSGTTLTLASNPKDVPYLCDPDGNSVMIVSGKGAGQMRYLMGNASPLSNRVNLDRAWDIPPDQSSIVTIVTTNGRMLFVNNDHGGAGPITNFFPSADVIHAHNRLHRFGAGIVQPSGFYTDASSLLTGWHSQMLNNEVTADAVANPSSLVGRTATFNLQGMNLMISEGNRENAWYTDAVISTGIIRNNRFAAGATGSVGLWDRVKNSLIENNTTPEVRIQNGNVNDALVRGNRTASGQPAPVIMNEPRPENGNLVLP
ncbi:hypothetical protein QY702_00675 [Xanthomonas campestris pv. plantaginis]|uniref:hypothetical protein n=1 Tax=Xanthomonas campestris TaxID=339 RepID=UPI002B22E0BB|nr:hypothetical protein [Xanthomonas campestris]MEA9604990.1 hypothetical protein [Xanthomonas campestris pv. plantaginis]